MTPKESEIEMKTTSAALLLFATFAVAATPTNASAYYDRRQVTQCSDNAAGNAIFGALLGGVAGALIGGRDAGVGAAIGASAGGILGLGLSCREQTVYIDNVDRYLDDDRYEEPCNWDGGSVIVTRSMLRYDGAVCREYQSTLYTPRGPVTKIEVACREGGHWRHGFNPQGLRVERDYREMRRRRDYYRDDRRGYYRGRDHGRNSDYYR